MQILRNAAVRFERNNTIRNGCKTFLEEVSREYARRNFTSAITTQGVVKSKDGYGYSNLRLSDTAMHL